MLKEKRRKVMDYNGSSPTSLLRIQWTMTMTKPCRESKTAKRIWNKIERLSVMASTADIQVRANRGRTTQELQREALRQKERDGGLNNKRDGFLFLVPKVFLPVHFLHRH